MPPKKKAEAKPKTPRTPRKKKTEPGSRGLSPQEVGGGEAPAAVTSLAGEIEADGGTVLSKYRDPLGGHWLILAALPPISSLWASLTSSAGASPAAPITRS